MKHEMTNKEYNEYVKTKTPNSKLFSNCLKAFVSGGIICVIGHFILTMFKKWGLDTEAAGTATSIILVFAGALLTGLDIYPKIAKFAGAGTIVPITGFANSVVSPALEAKTEGMVLGVGAKIFTIAGPVILYGTLASFVAGIVYLDYKFVLKNKNLLEETKFTSRRFFNYLSSYPPTGRIERTWHIFSPNTFSIFVLNSSSISSGTNACTVPAKPPP